MQVKPESDLFNHQIITIRYSNEDLKLKKNLISIKPLQQSVRNNKPIFSLNVFNEDEKCLI